MRPSMVGVTCMIMSNLLEQLVLEDIKKSCPKMLHQYSMQHIANKYWSEKLDYDNAYDSWNDIFEHKAPQH